MIQVVRISGTIKKSEEEAIRRARMSIVRVRKAEEKSRATNSGVPNETDLAHQEDDDDDIDMTGGIEDPDEPGDFDEDDND